MNNTLACITKKKIATLTPSHILELKYKSSELITILGDIDDIET